MDTPPRSRKLVIKKFLSSLFLMTNLLLPIRSHAKSKLKKKEVQNVTYTLQKQTKSPSLGMGRKKGQVLGVKSLQQKQLEQNSDLVIRILILQKTVKDLTLHGSNFTTPLPINGNLISILKYRSGGGQYAFLPDENKTMVFQAQNGLNLESDNQKNEKVNRFSLLTTLLANFKTTHPNVILGIYAFLSIFFLCLLLYYGPVIFSSVKSCLKVKVTKPPVQPAPLTKAKDTLVDPNPNSLFLKTEQLDRYVKLHGMEEELLKMVQEREFMLDLEKLQRNVGNVGKDINSQQDLDFVDSTKRELYEYLKNKVRKQQPPDL